MSRYHWWGFIVNEAGEPIKDAEVTVKLAGTDILANIYYDEFGNDNSALSPELSAGPQLTTLSNGYYEFWIGDSSQIYGYYNTQKFKLEWIRIGVASGLVDYVNVFPLGPQIEEMSVADCVSPSIQKNKTISDYYACKWDYHADSTITDINDNFVTIHGLDFVDTGDMRPGDDLSQVPMIVDTLPNKIINNYFGWNWEHHRLSTVQNYHPSAGTPHGFEEYTPGNGDALRNKLVSNYDLWNIHNRIDDLTVVSASADAYLQSQIDDLGFDTDQSRAGWWEIFGTIGVDGWTFFENDTWFHTIDHGLEIYYPFVQVYDKSNGLMVTAFEIEYIDDDTITIYIENENKPLDPTLNLIVRIGTGGVQRHPVPVV